jgi:hypothetical protein
MDMVTQATRLVVAQALKCEMGDSMNMSDDERAPVTQRWPKTVSGFSLVPLWRKGICNRTCMQAWGGSELTSCAAGF